MRFALLLIAAALSVGTVASAAPPPVPPVCRFCGMVMSTHPTALMAQRCRIDGHTFYCCNHCGPHQPTREMGLGLNKNAVSGRQKGGSMARQSSRPGHKEPSH